MGIESKFILFGVVLALCINPTVRAADLTEGQKLAKILQSVKGGALSARIEKFSERFVGAKYEGGPLGEGPKGTYDRNPLYRTDLFDCTTFVETVVSLSLAKQFTQFENTLRRIRYKNGEVNFTARNHFPCADWIPNNTQGGFITDITAEIAGPSGVLRATAEIDKKGWYQNLPPSTIRVPGLSPETQQRLHAELKKEGNHYSAEPATIPYIALDRILTRHEVTVEEQNRRKKEESELASKLQQTRESMSNTDGLSYDGKVHDDLVQLRLEYLIKDTEVDARLLEAIPSGTILNIVKPNWRVPGTHMNIFHQGFVIKRKEVPYFRHVSRTGGQRVKDVLLANYLRLCLLSPPIKGINLLRVNPN